MRSVLQLLFFSLLLLAGCGRADNNDGNDGFDGADARPDSATDVIPDDGSDSAASSGNGSADSTTVTLFMVETANDSEGGIRIGCGDLLVERQYRVPQGKSLLAEAMRALVAPENDGPENFVAGNDVRLDSAKISGGIARIYLGGVIPLAGVCDHPRVEEQLRRTAAQFPEVDSVIVYIGGERLEEYLSLK